MLRLLKLICCKLAVMIESALLLDLSSCSLTNFHSHYPHFSITAKTKLFLLPQISWHCLHISVMAKYEFKIAIIILSVHSFVANKWVL